MSEEYIFVDEFPTGRDSIEKAQGFKKMEIAFPVDKPRRQIDSEKWKKLEEGTPLSVKEAAELLVKNRRDGVRPVRTPSLLELRQAILQQKK
jgi:hypothetical protein